MVIGNFPFKKACPTDEFYRNFHFNQEKYWTFMLKLKESISEEFKDLMSKMMAEDPSNRLTVDGTIAHPWFLNPWNQQ